MGIKQLRPEIRDWLWEQREWSKFAEGVVLYYEAHGFVTEKQWKVAMDIYANRQDNTRTNT